MSLEAHFRQQLVFSLKTGHAHLPFEEAVAEFPLDKINSRPANVPYTYWHLIEHLRLTQRDILNYLIDPDYQEPHWPADYWPAQDATTDEAGWRRSIATFIEDRDRMCDLVNDTGVALTATVPTHDEHTILRGVMIVIDHNSYHVGELAILRHIDGTWGPSHQ